MAPRLALQVADRTVLAMTCGTCHRLCPGDAFDRYRRSGRDRLSYLSRRCRTCRWAHLDRSLGKAGIASHDRRAS